MTRANILVRGRVSPGRRYEEEQGLEFLPRDYADAGGTFRDEQDFDEAFRGEQDLLEPAVSGSSGQDTAQSRRRVVVSVLALSSAGSFAAAILLALLPDSRVVSSSPRESTAIDVAQWGTDAKTQDLPSEWKAEDLTQHSYAAPTYGRCVDSRGLEVQHIWRTSVYSLAECRKDCDKRVLCQAYAYHSLRAACNLYGAQLQAEAPLWDEGLPTSANCPVHGTPYSLLGIDKDWVCYVKTEAIYMRMAYGKDSCPLGRDIDKFADCEVAVVSLGYSLKTIYNGTSASMPCHCSIRGGPQTGPASDGDHLNWNAADECKARVDMAPVCFQDRGGCTWPGQ